MSENEVMDLKPLPAAGKWIPVLLLAWLVPGAGHFYLKKTYRGAILSGTILLTFLLGLMMRGYLFQPATGDLLTTLIYVGGYVANMATGALYGLVKIFGYDQPDIAGHTVDYGTKFLVAAGLFNILAMVDAFEIAVGRKE
jgi:TM2 domain-containing membrane protein YozV